MWIMDLQVAMKELFDIYGVYCTVTMIRNNIITMSDGSRWAMDEDGHICRFEEANF